MRYYIVTFFTSLGTLVLGDKAGYATEQEAIDAIAVIRASGAKNSNGPLTVIPML